MEQDGVILARRQSGGGAVYQDLGNSCFTFLSSISDYDIDRNTRIITEALRKNFGIDAQKTGRNDITVNGRKISGSAYKKSVDRAFHHGTILIDVDRDAFSRYLNPNKAKLQSKGVDSIQARVLNLVDLVPQLDHEKISDAIIQEFFSVYHDRCDIEILDGKKLSEIDSLNRYYQQIKDWNWRFGKSPNFEHHMETRFDWGTMEVYIKSSRGIIADVRIFSDSLFPPMIENLMDQLKGVSYDSKGIEEACERSKNTFKDVQGIPEQVEQFKNWLKESL